MPCYAAKHTEALQSMAELGNEMHGMAKNGKAYGICW